MIKIISTILIIVSSIASVYNSYLWVKKPETGLLYIKANFSRSGIQLLSLFLGIGGLLLLFPQTFKVGVTFLIIHSLTTLICYAITKDWKGGLREFILFQIPIFLFWAGYPLTVLEKFRNFFI
ncbi:MAG: hypothetical protein BGP14_13310 [Sphingobacteriales bacterium 44-15]|nr:MAG: hypothetical protein BGP14_13310 [Sphingobacteriales bacterium 44-15]